MDIFSMFFKGKTRCKKSENKFLDEKINEANLRILFDGCGDFQMRDVWPGERKVSGIKLCWIEGLTSGSDISQNVLKALASPLLPDSAGEAECMELLSHGGIYSNACQQRSKLSELSADLCAGRCALIFEKRGGALTFETKSQEKRAISQPTVEKTVKGGKDAFVETLQTNSALVRRRIRDPDLKLKELTVGRRSATKIYILYMEGIASPETVAETEKRLQAIDTDGLLSSGGIEQYITDVPRSPFPQLLHTERPDIFAGHLLAGRIGLLLDGLPLGFLLPVTMGRFLSVGEDRAQHYLNASLLILLRQLSFVLTVFLPAAFIAVSMYHQEMIPLPLLSSMINAKQEVPFSSAVEVLMMLAAFELLQEAGVRLPDPVGDTVSIIGALIVGQAAVEAKLVSPIAIIVVAASGICGFTQPAQDMSAALRLCRWALAFMSLALGMYGLMLGAAVLIYHLCSIESFGISYTAPISEGGFLRGLQCFFKAPLRQQKYRPEELNTPDKRRQK